MKGKVHKVHLSRPMYEEISLKISDDHPGTAVGKKGMGKHMGEQM